MNRRLAITCLGIFGVGVALVAIAGAAFWFLRPQEQLRPPAVVAYEPEQLREVAPKATIVVNFNTPMDKQSVEAAFAISPTVQGAFSWEGNDTLKFQPVGDGMTRDTTYEIRVGTSAKNRGNDPMSQPFAAQFTTAGDLAPVAFFPNSGATSVPTDNQVTVVFNRPVVAIQANSTPNLNPLQLTPAVDGAGAWINSTVYRFVPKNGLQPATEYTVQLKSDIQDVTGGRLASDVKYTFSTVRPALTTFTPTVSSRYVPPDQRILLVFNQPMDRASVADTFSLRGPAGQVAGTFQWDTDSRATFVPNQALQPDVSYTARLAAGLKGTAGPLPSTEETSWTFQTVGEPKLVSSRPAAGSVAPPTSNVVLTFNQPMSTTTLPGQLTILPEPTQVFSSWTDSNVSLNLFFTLKPSTQYSIQIGAGLKDRSGRPLTSPVRLSFTTGPTPPRVNLIKTQNTTTMLAGNPLYGAFDAVNVPSATLQLYQLSRQEYVTTDATFFNAKETPPGTMIREWQLNTSAPLNETRSFSQTLTLDGSPLPAGFYALTIRAGSSTDQQLLVVSRRALTLKTSADSALLWATDPATGEPVAGAPAVLLDQTGQVVTQTSGPPITTDKDGLAKLSVPQELIQKFGQPRVWAFLDEPQGPSVVASTWNNGISPFDFNLQQAFTNYEYQGAIFTERPIYRPGQDVYFKGVVRKDDDSQYALPTALASVPVLVRDANGRVVFSQTMTLDAFGTFNGQLSLSDSAAVGFWSIQAGEQQEGKEPPKYSFTGSFQVAEFRRPEFEVTVNTGRESYIQNEIITGAVTARYFFGAPADGAAVQWRVATDAYTFKGPQGSDYQGYTYGVYDLRPNPFGEPTAAIASGNGTLGAAGALTFSLPADIAQFQGSRIFTIEGQVTDESGQAISSRVDTVVHKGQLYIGLRNNAYIGRAGQASPFDVLSVDTGAKIVGGVDVSLDLASRRYYTVQERNPQGDLSYVTKYEDTPVPGSNVSVRTDSNGKATASFTPPKSGLYRVQATTHDQRGNEVKTVAFLWVSGSDYVNWGLENNDRIELVLDKSQYGAGDTAHMLVASPFEKATGLLTIERGTVRSTKLVNINSTSQVLDITITDDFQPNVYVSLVLFSGNGPSGPAAYKLGYTKLSVALNNLRLNVDAKTDKATYRPGDTAHYQVKVTDSNGKPVEGQVTVSVVDLAILSLSDSAPLSLFDVFYRERGLGVHTAATLAAAQSRLDLSARAPGKGGGGEQTAVRSVFADTAYWNPTLTTNAQGEATFDVKLPDNLTTWRLTARAVTKDSRFGQTTLDVVSNKDLLLRPELPRFLTSGDEVELQTIVQNLTDQAINTDVGVQADGLTPVGVFDKQRVSVPAHGSKTVSWRAKSNEPRTVKITFRADPQGSGVPGDAVELSLPVMPLATPEVVATSGQVALETTEKFQLQGNIDPSLGELTIELAPSLTSGLETGVRQLNAFPYEPTEVIVSRMLTGIDFARVLSATGTLSDAMKTKVDDDMAQALQKLYRNQHPDGGWGWFATDSSQPFLSAYVVDGMVAAQNAGQTVDPNALNRAATYLNNYLTRPVDFGVAEDVDTRAYVLSVLARKGKPNTGQNGSLYERRDALSAYGRGYLLTALVLGNNGTLESRGQTLINEIAGTAVWTATGAHWDDPSGGRTTFGSYSRSTAVVLQALLGADPQNPLIEPAVRWLMSERQSGWWGTTFDSAVSLSALADFVTASGDRQPNYKYTVSLNGSQIGQGNVTSQSADPRTLTIAVGKLIANGANTLVMQRDANSLPSTSGRLYYTASLRYFKTGEKVDAESHGISVGRDYLTSGSSASPVTSGKVGQTVKVKLTIVAESDLDYAIIEDALPAGAEAIDPNLATTSIFEQTTNRQQWHFSNVEVRDEKVVLFARSLPKGTYEFSYLIRLTTPGNFVAQPARASLMYFPEVWGRTAGSKIDIQP